MKRRRGRSLEDEGREEYGEALDELVRLGLVRDLGDGWYALSPGVRLAGGGGQGRHPGRPKP